VGSAIKNADLLRRPPHGFGTGDATACRTITTSGAASTAQVDLLLSNTMAYVIMRFTGDCFVRMGPTGLADAVVTDWPAKSGEIWEWLAFGALDRYCKIIRGGAVDVSAIFYLSDRRT
jgi:hypothetical protein